MTARTHLKMAGAYIAALLLVAAFNDAFSWGGGLFAGMATVHLFDWWDARREGVSE